jgi:hypothetical protein
MQTHRGNIGTRKETNRLHNQKRPTEFRLYGGGRMKTIIQKDIKDFVTIKIKLKSMGEYKRLIRKLKRVGKFATRHEIPLEIEIAKTEEL